MDIEIGAVLCGRVTKTAPYGAFVALEDGKSGLVHISEISTDFVRDISAFVNVGDEVKVKVIGIDENGRLGLSIKQANSEANMSTAPVEYEAKTNDSSDFEDMMKRFMSDTKDTMSALKQRGTVDIKRRRTR